jgi:integrase
MAHVAFTKRTLEALPPASGSQRIYHYDTQVRGLAVAVSHAGRKTFCLYRKISGRPERIPIGRFPDLTVEQARGIAHDLNAAIAKGLNPADRLRTGRRELVLADLFQEYVARHVSIHCKSAHNVEWLFKVCLAPLSKRKLSSIRSGDVVRLHSELGRSRGPYTANRSVELLRTMFNRAHLWELFHGPNPTLGVQRFREQKRARFLHADELPRFFQSLAEEFNRDAREFFLLSLLTGARRSNVQAMRWDEINFNRSTWTIPALHAKGGEAMVVPLVASAVAILSDRQGAANSQWVFPGRGKTGHLVEPKTAWRRLLYRAGLRDLRMHDLRRTLGSWQAATGASLPIIGKSLGHKSTEATAIYARLDLDPVRRSMVNATDAILEAARPIPTKTLKGVALGS